MRKEACSQLTSHFKLCRLCSVVKRLIAIAPPKSFGFFYEMQYLLRGCQEAGRDGLLADTVRHTAESQLRRSEGWRQ